MHPERVHARSAPRPHAQLPLITRDPRSGELAVNFDPMLVKLLCEVKYFVVQGKDIPEVAAALRSGAGDLVLSQLEHLVADAAFVAHREGFGAVVGVRLQELFA